MPLDKNDIELGVGDIVNIRARVTDLNTTEDGVNCTVQPIDPAQGSEFTPTIHVNSRQVQLLTKEATPELAEAEQAAGQPS